MTVGNDLASACIDLGRLDTARLRYGQDYRIDLQATRNQAERQGRRLGPLITDVNPQVFSRPTFRLFLALLDNYKRVTGTAETFGPQEEREISDFLDAIIATQPMEYVHKWLSSRNLMAPGQQQWKAALHQMWFALYRREVQNDSSGFEHVFLGESDEGQVKGLHSWIQFHLEERCGNLEYKGYLQPRSGASARMEAKEDDRVISVHFAWMRQAKAVSSIIMGSTPEFELALYTLCFLGGQEVNLVALDNYQLKIKAYKIRSKHGDKIGTVYPELLSKGAPGAAAYGGGAVAPPPHQSYQQQPPHQQQQAWGQQGGAHGNPQPAAWGGQPQAHSQQQPQQNQGNNDAISQGCSLFSALLNIFCAGDKNKRQ